MAARRKQKAKPEKDEADRDHPEEFKRMEDLARKLVQVPKHELDERRKGTGS